MELHEAGITDARQQRRRDLRRLQRALTCSLAAILLLLVLHVLSAQVDIRPFTIRPWDAAGLLGLITAPLLHASWQHVTSNAIAILILGTLAASVYPRASLRALPPIWLGSGLAAWLLGDPGEHHLGASGITHGLMLMTFVLGLLRRERSAVAAAMIAFLLYGGMLITVFPFEQGVSWQSHLGGALAGVLSAFLLRHADPPPPRRVYAYELEPEEPEAPAESLE